MQILKTKIKTSLSKRSLSLLVLLVCFVAVKTTTRLLEIQGTDIGMFVTAVSGLITASIIITVRDNVAQVTQQK